MVEKTDISRISFCTFYLLFWFKITSNFIFLCSRQLRAHSIFILVVADDIFIVKGINKVIKSIAEHIR